MAVAILVYPERGNNRNRISPDILVGLGLGMRLRSSCFVWEEGKPPAWVLEVASPCKEADDRGFNREYYAEMGVPEYRYPEVAKLVRHRHEIEADIERDEAATERAEAQASQEVARRKAAETRIAELKAARRRLSAGHPP